MDPNNLPEGDISTMNFESATGAKAWRDIWGSGQGIGAVTSVLGAGDYVDRLAAEYHEAKQELAAKAR
jgi:nitronate monooxygenase